MKPLGYALVGCGGAAHDVARALDRVEDARVVAAYDVSSERAGSIAANRGATVHASLEALLDDESVSVVYVGLPHDRLAATASAALHAGRDVIVEKPAATNARDAAEVARLADTLGRVASVMFEFRASAPVVEAKRILASGTLGPVRAIRVSTVIDKPADYWRSGPTGMVEDSWRANRERAGGGVVLMNSIHQIDAVRFMTGLDVVRAAGEVATFAQGVEVEDTAGALLRLTGGAIATVAAAAHSHGAHDEETISIDCAAGRIDLPDPYGGAQLRVFETSAGRWLDSPASAHGSHEQFLRSFTAAVLERAAPPASVWDAVAALSVVEAIYRAAQAATAVKVERYSA